MKIDTEKLQKEIFANKLEKFGRPVSVEREFCYTYGELNEAFDSWLKEDGNVGEELADVAIYLFGLAELLGIDLGDEIISKVSKNKGRTYHLEGKKSVKD